MDYIVTMRIRTESQLVKTLLLLIAIYIALMALLVLYAKIVELTIPYSRLEDDTPDRSVGIAYPLRQSCRCV